MKSQPILEAKEPEDTGSKSKWKNTYKQVIYTERHKPASHPFVLLDHIKKFID